MIELSGASIPAGTFANGLEIEADKCTVKGLVISNWENGAFLDVGATGNTVRGNFIGTDASDTQDLGNNIGVVALDANNTVGGTTPAVRNIISGNTDNGVEVFFLPSPPSPPPDPATGNRILSNSIYDNGDANPANGEGKKFLGQKSVTTNDSGNATFAFKTKKKVPNGQVVSATATNQTTGDTSEFSKACTVPGVPCP